MRTCALALVLVMSGCTKNEVKPDASVTTPTPTARVIDLEVTSEGFVPAKLTVKANEPLTLRVTRKTDETCATDLLIEGTDINVPLPLGKTVSVSWTPTHAGAVKYGCAMDKMIGGVLLVE